MEASMSAKRGLSLLFGGPPSSFLEIHEPLLEILGQLGSEDVAVIGSDAWGFQIYLWRCWVQAWLGPEQGERHHRCPVSALGFLYDKEHVSH